MLAINEIKVPDIGDFKDVPVIEVHVQAGATVNVDDPLVTLESDKATMDVPAPQAGTVEEVLIKLGDRVSEGTPILRLRAEDAAARRAGDAAALGDRAAGARAAAAAGRAADRRSRARPTRRGQRGRLRRFRRRACQPLGAPPGARARRRSHQAQGHGREGPHHRGGREDLPARPGGGARRRRRAGGRHGHPRDPGGGLLEIRPDRDQAAAAHQAALRAAPAPLLAQRPARHPWRRGGHHRDRRLPEGAGHGGQGEGLPRHAALLPAQGERLGAARASRSSTARSARRRTR